MSQYAKLDEMIISSIDDGPKTFHSIWYGLRFEAEKFCKEGQEAWRVIDRRLQAMRKKGDIRYDKKTGWHVVWEVKQ
jgi:hypothetical protein